MEWPSHTKKRKTSLGKIQFVTSTGCVAVFFLSVGALQLIEELKY